MEKMYKYSNDLLSKSTTANGRMCDRRLCHRLSSRDWRKVSLYFPKHYSTVIWAWSFLYKPRLKGFQVLMHLFTVFSKLTTCIFIRHLSQLICQKLLEEQHAEKVNFPESWTMHYFEMVFSQIFIVFKCQGKNEWYLSFYHQCQTRNGSLNINSCQ